VRDTDADSATLEHVACVAHPTSPRWSLLGSRVRKLHGRHSGAPIITVSVAETHGLPFGLTFMGGARTPSLTSGRTDRSVSIAALA